MNIELKRIGVVGLGLLGSSIAANLLHSGFNVIGCDTSSGAAVKAENDIARAFQDMEREFGLSAETLNWQPRYRSVDNITELAPCDIIIESVTENLELKLSVYGELEEIVPADTVIACNTSNYPITLMQKDRQHPGRFVGMHWGQPAYIKRYLEIIKGDQTGETALQTAVRLAEACGKEPSVLKKDIRGYISNRIQYAMMREAFFLVERGVADFETIDLICQNTLGWWLALAGPFRWMDLTGIPAYRSVMTDLFPDLCTDEEVPELMEEVCDAVDAGTRKGFYEYPSDEFDTWQRKRVQFTFDIKRLMDKYRPVS